jgi:hypothetical protein
LASPRLERQSLQVRCSAHHRPHRQAPQPRPRLLSLAPRALPRQDLPTQAAPPLLLRPVLQEPRPQLPGRVVPRRARAVRLELPPRPLRILRRRPPIPPGTVVKTIRTKTNAPRLTSGSAWHFTFECHIAISYIASANHGIGNGVAESDHAVSRDRAVYTGLLLWQIHCFESSRSVRCVPRRRPESGFRRYELHPCQSLASGCILCGSL